MTAERETIWEVLTFKICLGTVVEIPAGEGGSKDKLSGACFGATVLEGLVVLKITPGGWSECYENSKH